MILFHYFQLKGVIHSVAKIYHQNLQRIKKRS